MGRCSGESGNFVITGAHHGDVQRARTLVLNMLPPGALEAAPFDGGLGPLGPYASGY